MQAQPCRQPQGETLLSNGEEQGGQVDQTA
jgi:hypothetical protein